MDLARNVQCEVLQSTAKRYMSLVLVIRHHYLVDNGRSEEGVFGHHHPGLFLNPVLLLLCLASAIKASNLIR